MHSRHRFHKQGGFIIPYILCILSLSTLIIGGYLLLTSHQQQRSDKLTRQNQATHLFESTMLGKARTQILTELETTGHISENFLPTSPVIELDRDALSPYQINASASRLEAPLQPSQRRSAQYTCAALNDLASMLKDPYRGVPIDPMATDGTTYIHFHSDSTYDKDAKHNEAAPELKTQFALNLRRIPVSAFSIYSHSGNVTIKSTSLPFTKPNENSQLYFGKLGRTYINGDVCFQGNIVSYWPINVTKQIIQQKKSHIRVQDSLLLANIPSAKPFDLSISTTCAQWPVIAKEAAHGTINTGNVVPVTLAQTPKRPAMKDYIDECHRKVTCNFDPKSSAYQFIVESPYRDPGFKLKPEASLFTVLDNNENPNKGTYSPVIVFDYQKIITYYHDQLIDFPTTFYIAVGQKNPQHGTPILYIKNASFVRSPISIVTPYPIYILGGFNSRSQSMKLRYNSVSLVTKKEVHFVEPNWKF